MATDFVAGSTYTNAGAGAYSGSISLAPNNTQKASIPAETYFCKRNTSTFVVMVDGNGVPHRLRKHRDLNGRMVYTHGRFAGAPILRS